MAFYIKKSSGEEERFNIKKFAKSLKRAGANQDIIKKLILDIQNVSELKTTKDVYDFAYNYLKKIDRPLASRYNLKNALYEFGPTGFPFEKFVAEIFRYQKYDVKIDQVVKGFCVEHEVDVIAVKNKRHFMVECKFHNQPGIKSDVKVALYVKARFDDIERIWIKLPDQNIKFHQGWLVTNTKFTEQAIQFAQCAKINLLGWSYPEEDSIAQLIDKLGLHPIICLSSLNNNQKKYLIDQGIILCRDLEKNINLLIQIGLNSDQAKQIIEECIRIYKIF